MDETRCNDTRNDSDNQITATQTDSKNNAKDNKAESVDAKDTGDALEAALSQLGHFLLYQKYTVFMLCVPNVLAAMYSLNYVFVADQVPYRCVIPECEGVSPLFSNSAAQQLSNSCQRYAPLHNNYSSCDREHYHPTDTQPCDDLVYLNNDTIFAEFDLGCQEWRRTLVGTVRNSALPLALILTGYISDSWGRRTAFCIFSAFAGVMGIVKGFSVNYQMYVTLEFFEAALGYGFNSAGYVMMVELARPSLRASFACATGVAYGLGGVIFALVAWLVPYWRRLLWTIHTPALLLPLYWKLVDESPRWLHAKGRRDEAAQVISKAARWNKVKLDDDLMKALQENNDTKASEAAPKENPWLGLMKSKVLMGRLALCGWCWIGAAFVYYGLTINSVSLAGDKYVNFALNMSMEIVASLLIMMALERFGRRLSIFVSFLLCGFACVMPFFVSHAGASLGFYFLGKLSITFAFNSLYVFTAELFPTRARSSALAACSLIARFGSVLAPQTPLLSWWVQALLYGVCSLVSAAAVLLVPETRRAPLPTAVKDAERMRGGRADQWEPSATAAEDNGTAPRVLSADT